MSELFGAPSGYIAASNERHTDAMTRLGLANAEAAEMNAQKNAQLMQLFARPPNANGERATPEQLIQRLQDNAGAALDAGFWKEGDEMAKTASTMSWNIAKSKHDQNLDKRMALQAQIAATERLDGILATVTDQPSLDKAIQLYESQNPDDPIPNNLRAYDPQLFEQLKTGTKGGLATARAEYDRLNKESLADRREAAVRLAEERLEFLKQQAKVREQDALRREKSGGPKAKEVGLPNKDMIGFAQSVIKEAYPDLAADMPGPGKELISRGAYAIASKAKAAMAANPGLSSDEAIQQAFNEAKERGEFKTDPGEEGFPWIGNRKPSTKYGRGNKGTDVGPGSKSQPLPTPEAGETPKEGMYYNSKYGVGKVVGGKFVVEQ